MAKIVDMVSHAAEACVSLSVSTIDMEGSWIAASDRLRARSHYRRRNVDTAYRRYRNGQ